jgi:indole-3-acetate monooxygenase
MNETMTHPDIAQPTAIRTSSAVIAAQELAQLVEDNREALAKGPDLPPSLAEGLIQAGLTQLWAPHALGGAETDPLEFVRVIEALAKLDGAVAWCAMILSGSSRFHGMIATEPMRHLIPAGKMYACSGSGHPTGTITRDGDGWRVDGRWTMASFCQYSTITFLVCMEHELPGGVQGIRRKMMNLPPCFMRRCTSRATFPLSSE